jgi:hypothetical protein
MLLPQVCANILAVSIRVISKECLLGRRAFSIVNLAYVHIGSDGCAGLVGGHLWYVGEEGVEVLREEQNHVHSRLQSNKQFFNVLIIG